MGFADEFDKSQKERATDGGFFKFKKDGDYKFRIMCEPIKKVSRWGYGICYEGAPYCQKDALEADYKAAQEKAKAEGKDPKKVNRPSLSIKWMVWAFDYGSEAFVIFDMPNPVATTMREFMDSEEYGFKEFPMPYDVTVKVKNAGQTSVEYTVLAARANTEIPAERMEEFAKLTPIAQIKERLQAKQKEKIDGGGSSANGGVDYPEEDINPDDIPF